METTGHSDGFERTLARVPSCRLDADGRRSQAARYRGVAQSVTAVRQEPDAVLVDFGPDVDPALVEEIVAVERECCQSLTFVYDPFARRLTITAAGSDVAPALDAIRHAFAPAIQ